MNLPDPKSYGNQFRIFSDSEAGKILPNGQKPGARASKSRWAWKGRSIQYKPGSFVNRNSVLGFFKRQNIKLKHSFFGLYIRDKEIIKQIKNFVSAPSPEGSLTPHVAFAIETVKTAKGSLIETPSPSQQIAESSLTPLDRQLIMKKRDEALKKKAPPEELELILRRNLPLLERTNSAHNVEKIRNRIINAIDQLIEISKTAESVGNKAANLQRLQQIFKGNPKVVVPRLKAISHADTISYVRTHFKEFDALWKQFLAHIKAGKDVNSAAPILAQIQAGITKTLTSSNDFPSDQFIKTFVGGKPIMIRSTGREDTLKSAGNLGGNTSIANVMPSRKDITAAIAEVVTSYFSTKSLGQRAASGDTLLTEFPAMAVLLQDMVGEDLRTPDPEGVNIPVSGVLYTTEGELNTQGVMQVNATYGHAEGVVTGSQASDLFYVQKDHTHSIIQRKGERRIPGKSGVLETAPNPKTIRDKPCLNQSQLKRLYEIGTQLEETYGYPLDIEWSYDPKTDIFYIFQARPIAEREHTSPTHLNPLKLKELSNLRQVSVIGAAGGQALVLNNDNILESESAPEALKRFLARPDPPPKAIILARPTAINSHEAGFFRQRRIPVIYIPPEQIKGVKEAMRTKSFLLDTAEGLLCVVPEGVDPTSFISQGLRRHLAPKMESSIQVNLTDAQIAKIKEPWILGSEKVKGKQEQSLVHHIKGTFGTNLLDKLLNAYETANTLEERDYIMVRLVGIIQKRMLPKMPEDEAKAVLSKIMRNVELVRKAYNDPEVDDINRKFAMNWLRAAVLRRPMEGVMNSSTLYTALDNLKERQLLGITPQGIQDIDQYKDIFRRSSKFILLPEIRRNWESFIASLSLEQSKKLADVFASLGPKVMELWINSSFPSHWKNSGQDSIKCLDAAVNEVIGTDRIKKAALLADKCRDAAAKMERVSADFGDPDKFTNLMEMLEKELLPVSARVLQGMKKVSGLEATLLSESFGVVISAFDNCIKGLTSSPYAGRTKEKVERFGTILRRYLYLTVRAMGPGMLDHDPALKHQAKKLRHYLFVRFKELLTEAGENPSKMLLPSADFNVAMAALGSGLGAPSRAEPNTLEDDFTLLHQCLIAANKSIGSKGGIKIKDLPQVVKGYCDDVCKKLILSRWGDPVFNQPNPTIQSVSYNHPNIQISFNCPLKNHSAQWHIHAKVDVNGRVQNVEFEGNFFAPGLDRGPRLTAYAKSLYYSSGAEAPIQNTPMVSPIGYKMRYEESGAMQFRWQLFPLDGDVAQNWQNAQTHLQVMLDYLQGDGSLPELTANIQFYRENPWAIDHFSLREQTPQLQKEVISAACEGSIENMSLENMQAIIGNYHWMKGVDQNLLSRFLDSMLDKPEIMLQTRPEVLVNFLLDQNNNGLITPKRNEKIKALIPQLPRTIEGRSQYYYEERYSTFVSTFN